MLETGIWTESLKNLAQESSGPAPHGGYSPRPKLASARVGYRAEGIQAREFMKNHS